MHWFNQIPDNETDYLEIVVLYKRVRPMNVVHWSDLWDLINKFGKEDE